MRRVVGVELVSVDGVMESPEEANASGNSLIGSPSSQVGRPVEHGELALRGEHRRKERP